VGEGRLRSRLALEVLRCGGRGRATVVGGGCGANGGRNLRARGVIAAAAPHREAAGEGGGYGVCAQRQQSKRLDLHSDERSTVIVGGDVLQ
jgi:hypothetical protein